MSPRCEKCDITESRLREIYHTLVGDKAVVESGIEDVGSSAGSQTDVRYFTLLFIRRYYSG